MPRLSNNEYYDRHDYLRNLWLTDERLFSLLKPVQQLELHRYYQPDHEMNQQDLKLYRAQITKAEPSLPARASKIYAHFARRLESAKSGDMVAVSGVLMRSEPDYRRLARASINLARWQRERVGKMQRVCQDGYKQSSQSKA